MDDEQLIAFISSAPPEKLSALLVDLLSAPVQTYSALCMVLPNLTLRISRALLVPDEEPINPLRMALEDALKHFELDPGSDTFVASGLPPRDERKLTWLLGRLTSVVVLARQQPVWMFSGAVRSLIQPETPGARVLQAFGAQESITQKQLLTRLKSQDAAHSWSGTQLRPLLLALVRAELLQTETSGANLIYRLGPVGVRLLAEQSSFLSGVEEAYRAYRLGHPSPPSRHSLELSAIFARVDAEKCPLR